MIFSIIIPCYKVARYVSDCLESVLAQQEASWEAICVDDGSSDGTGQLLDGYAAKDPRIRIIHQRNKGLSGARNAALAVACGEWLYYLDSDDVISPWALQCYSDAIQQAPNADLVQGGKVDFADGQLPMWKSSSRIFSFEDCSTMVLAKPFAGFFPQFVYRRATLGDLRFVGESWCEERPYVARCVARARGIVWMNGCSCYGYRVRQGSICQSGMTLSQNKGFLDATRDMLRTLRDSGKVLDAGLVRMMLIAWTEFQANAIETLLPRKDRAEAWHYLLGTLRETSEYKPQTFWRRMTILICRLIPCRIVAIPLFYWPHRLKLALLRHRTAQ